MRRDGVVMLARVVGHHARLGPVAEPFHVEAFVAQLTAKTVGRAILPGLVRADQRCLNALLHNPLQKGERDGFRAIVRTRTSRSPAFTNEVSLYLDNSAPADRPGHINGQAFPSVLTDQRQAFDFLADSACVNDEIIGPYLVDSCCRQR